MADVSLDKTDPQIKHIRPITKDALTKFQLERPIILAYKVWTPYMEFIYKTVSSSLTQITLPYDIQSITGIWYYKYTDIMDDEQRFVRETIMEKGEPVVGYRIWECETYDGILYCDNKIYFDIPLTSRKIWIEGVGQAEGYLQANESTLEPVGEFRLKRFNIYSESQQRIIPDSGSKELPINAGSLKLYWGTTSTSSSSPDNGEWNNGLVCACRPSRTPWSLCWEYPTASGNIFIQEYTNTRNIRFVDDSGAEKFTYSYQYGESVNDITNRTETCHDFVPDFGRYTVKRNREENNWSQDGIEYYWNTQGIGVAGCSLYNTDRWITTYRKWSSATIHTFEEQSAGICTCGTIGAICWGGCDCESGSSKTNYYYNATHSAVINICGTERILATGQSSNYQWSSSSCINGVTTNQYDNGPTSHSEIPYPIAGYIIQKKKFETEDTTDAILGKFYYRTDISDNFGSGTVNRHDQYPPFLTVFKLDENGLVEKNWNADFISGEYLGTIFGLDTDFGLTYVRL